MGRPRLFVGVSAGNLDSMLNKLTAQKKVRSRGSVLARRAHRTAPEPRDASSTRTSAGRRSPACRSCSAGSRRRSGASRTTTTGRTQVRRSILLDAKADLLVFGMGERAGVGDRAAPRARARRSRDSRDVRGTAHVKNNRREWEPLAAEPSRYVTDGKMRRPAVVRGGRAPTSRPSRAMSRRVPVRDQPGQRPPAPAAARRARRSTSTRPRCRSTKRRWTGSTICRSRARRTRRTTRAHPRVRDGQALDRDDARLLRRLHVLQHHRARGARHPEPLGGERAARGARALAHGRTSAASSPTSAGRPPTCTRCAARTSAIENACRRLSCVHPGVCENLVTDHEPLIDLMRAGARGEGRSRRVFIASGVRYDLAERSPEFIRELARAPHRRAALRRARAQRTRTCSTR